MTHGVREIRALEVSLLLLLEPVLSACWAWAVHSEPLGAWAVTGCVVILAASAGLALLRADENAPPAHRLVSAREVVTRFRLLSREWRRTLRSGDCAV